MNSMKYKDYIARIEFDDVDRIFMGHLVGIDTIVGFHGVTVDELEKTFKESVDNYIEISHKLGANPQKPYSGKLIMRMLPNIHARCAMLAEAHGKSLNQWMVEVLEQEISALVN